MESDQKIKSGEAILAYWRQWLINYRKQHPKAEDNAKSNKPKVVKPETITSEELVSIRNGLELTQRELAFKLGITKRQLSRLETGKCGISNKIMSRLRGHLVNGDTYLLE